MKIAVLTLTRDRLDYTKHCFATLRRNAGCDFDHYVFDNGSTDGTPEWLVDEYKPKKMTSARSNLGIHTALNFLLDDMDLADCDLVVNVDNDCEVVTPGTLHRLAEVILADPEQLLLLSPLIVGLRNRPPVRWIETVHGARVGITGQIGGIFMPIPPLLLEEGFRFDESAPVWGGNDELLSATVKERGGTVGYLLDWEANHYLTTEGQAADKPEYFARRVREGGPPL